MMSLEEEKLIYIAGPLSNGDPAKVEANVKRAADIGTVVWQAGFVPFVPHLAWGQFYYNLVPYEQAMSACLNMVRRSKAVLLLHGWRTSKGAVREGLLSSDLNIPTTSYPGNYCDPERLKRWMDAVLAGDYPIWDTSYEEEEDQW